MNHFAPAVLVGAALLAPVTARAQQDPRPPPAMHVHTGDQLFESREASGTAWVPDSTPMFGVHRTIRGWTVMGHGVVFGQFLYEPGDIHRTGGFQRSQVSSVNWGMIAARRQVGAGRIGVRFMGSLEPWTVDNCGFLNLLATGEMCEGDTIHDRQHPHDVLMEIAGEYSWRPHGSWGVDLYGGLSGEPALGPPAFPHRLSATVNPVAPISHHWLDSTHVSFGLITAGLRHRRWKAEVSVFNGREPDEHRADLDLGPLDSVSGRVTMLSGDNFALQVSAGHLHEAEQEFPPNPPADVFRGTASATYHRRLAGGREVAVLAAFGLNSGREFIPGGSFTSTTPAGLVEGTVTLHERHVIFGRVEIVRKPAEDLHAHEFATEIFTVGKLQVGYTCDVIEWKGTTNGIGGTFSLALPGAVLAPRYEGRAAPEFGVFWIVRVGRRME